MDLKNIITSFQINQVGVAVHSVDRAALFMENAFGVKMIVIPMPRASAILRGREVSFTTKIGLARAGNVDLEFMEIVDGEHLVRELLDSRGPGIHHLGMYVEDLDAAVDAWQQAGGKILQRTKHPSGIGTAFLDTEKELGGIYFELIKL